MKSRLVLVFTLLATVLGVATPAAQAFDPATMETAATISELPFESVEDLALSWSSEPAMGPSNAAVAAACNAGSPIYSTYWRRWSAPIATFVRASADVFYTTSGVTIPGAVDQGIAFVSAAGVVLDCRHSEFGSVSAGTPAMVAGGITLYVVHFVKSAQGLSGVHQSHRSFKLEPLLAPPVTGLTVTRAPAAASATLTWQSNPLPVWAPITGYRVERDGTGSGRSGPSVATLGADARSHTFTGLLPGVRYTLTVRSIDGLGRLSLPTSIRVTLTTPPAAPPTAVNRTIRITKVAYNPPGTDTRRNINGEYLRLRNTGTDTVTLTRWTVGTAAGTSYTFRTTRLRAGASITVFTGKGVDTSTSRYRGKTMHLWKNSGKDVASVRDHYNRTVDTCAWTARSRGYTAC